MSCSRWKDSARRRNRKSFIFDFMFKTTNWVSRAWGGLGLDWIEIGLDWIGLVRSSGKGGIIWAIVGFDSVACGLLGC